MDRIREVIKGQRKIAVFPIVGADHCAWLLNKEFSSVASSGERLAEVLRYGYNLYQYDMILVFSDPYVEAQALGCPIELEPFPKLLGPKSNSGIDRTKEIIKATVLLKQSTDCPIFVSIKGPFSLAGFLAGIENFLKTSILKEKEAKALINYALEFQINYLNRLLSQEANIFIGDPLASVSIISPELFSLFAYEPLRILIKKIKETGLLVGLHICGETKPIIPILDSLGADILSLEDLYPKSNTLRMGGISTQTIFFSTPKEIARAVKSVLTNYQLAPSLILATACDVPMTTNPDNIKAMVRAANEFNRN